MILSPVPLEIAFSTTLLSNDMDAEARLKRRERIACQPIKKNATSDPKMTDFQRHKASRRKDATNYDLDCSDPVAEMSEQGPRCAKRSTKSKPMTCPHCLHILGLEHDSEQFSAGLPFSHNTYDDNYPTVNIVDELSTKHVRPAPDASDTLQRAVIPRELPTTTVEPFSVAVSRLFKNVSTEMVYALLILVGLMLILRIDSQTARRARID